MRTLMGKWELQKRAFDGTAGMVVDLPPKLAVAWAQYKTVHYEECGAEDDDDDTFGELHIELPVVTRMFDTVPLRLRCAVVMPRAACGGQRSRTPAIACRWSTASWKRSRTSCAACRAAAPPCSWWAALRRRRT
jgi:hypothetical protein